MTDPILTTDKLKALRQDIDAALIAVSQKNGLESLRTGNCKYDHDGSFTFQLKGLVAGGLSAEATRYNANQQLFDLPALGTIITLAAKPFGSL